ncbi:MAG: Mut7-C RNAse domain-containing protein [Thermodesulfobacteriota bacterium]
MRPGKTPRLADGRLAWAVERRAAVKDVVESLGVPHTEVGRLVVAGPGGAGRADADFSHIVGPGQELDVYAVAPPLDVTRPSLLRPEPLEEVRFLVDATCGKLARLLRLVGQDAAYDRSWDDAAVAELAAEEGRIVLSMDRALLKRRQVAFGRLVRAHDPREQLAEVLRHFGVRGPFAAFSRCLECNAPLTPVAKAEVLHRLPPLTRKHFEAFSRCPACDRIYWAGSHHDRMREWLARSGLE